MSSSINANNNAKGIALEELFRDYMQKELGYHKARTRAQVVSDFNSRGINVDVIGEVGNSRFILMRIGSIFMYILALSTLLFMILSSKYQNYSLADYIIYLGFILIFCGLCITYFKSYIKNRIQHGWAECKNQQEAISTELMQLAIVRFNSYQNTKNKEYTFTNIYFVSAGSFSEGALKLAQDKNVKCYKLECGNFVQVTYW